MLRWWLVSLKVSWIGKKACHCKGPSGALRRSVNNRTIWPTISSSRCDSLKLCSNRFDHQSKLAFIWFSPLISTSFLSLSAHGDLLFSSPRPFDLGLWALVFTAQKGPHTESKSERSSHFVVLPAFSFFKIFYLCHHPSFHLLCAAFIICAVWVEQKKARGALKCLVLWCHDWRDLDCILKPEPSSHYAAVASAYQCSRDRRCACPSLVFNCPCSTIRDLVMGMLVLIVT